MKITKFRNKKENKDQYRARFQLNEKEFRPVADSRKKLLEMIDEIRAQEHRTKFELPVMKFSPTVKELFDKYEAMITGPKKKTLFRRVSEKFLKLNPPEIKVNELKKIHFKKYIDTRLGEKNPQSKEPILPETVNKELSALSSALKTSAHFFSELEDMPVIQIPKVKESNRRRERLVSKSDELALLLAELRKAHRNPVAERARKNLADDLEIRYETGLRRKEVARLEKSQYRREESCLRNVRRWKTDSVTKFFPLTKRAVEIIESRLEEETESIYIFTKNGKPSESIYQTLIKVCARLGINYGTHSKDGFVPHDLRHNFATEIIQVTDIETAKSLTGHTGNHILTYLHTNENLQREAMRKREGIDLDQALTALYNQIKNGNMDVRLFIEKMKILITK